MHDSNGHIVFWRYPWNIHFIHPNEKTIQLPWMSDLELEFLQDTQSLDNLTKSFPWLGSMVTLVNSDYNKKAINFSIGISNTYTTNIFALIVIAKLWLFFVFVYSNPLKSDRKRPAKIFFHLHTKASNVLSRTSFVLCLFPQMELE